MTNTKKKVVEAAEPEDNRVTADDLYESLTDYEEMAIEKAFGSDPMQLASSGKMVRFLRALIFIDVNRNGKNVLLAKQEAMAMRNGDVLTYFAEPEVVEESEDEEDLEDPKDNEELNEQD